MCLIGDIFEVVRGIRFVMRLITFFVVVRAFVDFCVVVVGK